MYSAIGVFSISLVNGGDEDLIKAADVSFNAAKRAGRNQVASERARRRSMTRGSTMT